MCSVALQEMITSILGTKNWISTPFSINWKSCDEFLDNLPKFFCFHFTFSQKEQKTWMILEAVARKCSTKKVFLKILWNLQENTCAKVSFLIKLTARDLQIYQRRDLETGVFNTFFIQHLQCLLLWIVAES